MAEMVNKTKEGIPTKQLYIKHLSEGDWECIDQIRAENNDCSIADAVRMALRKAAGRF